MDTNDLETLYNSLAIVRKATEDDFEVRSSADGKIWAVKAIMDTPKKPTYCFYTGADAQELAADFADMDLEEDLEDNGDEENEEDDDEEDEE